MKPTIFPIAAIALVGVFHGQSVIAQSTTSDTRPQTRAEKRAEGVEAARNFESAEGNPVPDARPKSSPEERASARQARAPEGSAAARSFRPGEGDPKPKAVAKQSPEQRRAARLTKRAEVEAANKAGQIPSYGDNYGN